MSCLPREVLKWLQSLDLVHPVRNPKRDFCNGYLVAEILGWYFPKALHVHTFVDGQSLSHRLGNWKQLERFFAQEGIYISKEMIEGTLHCKTGAAEALVNILFSTLTNRTLALPVHSLDGGLNGHQFTDSAYQATLPSYARSTASQSLKNNLAITELSTEQDHVTSQHKAEMILVHHLEQRRTERTMDPERFKTGKSKQRHTGQHLNESREKGSQTTKQSAGTTATDNVEFIEVNQPSGDGLS